MEVPGMYVPTYYCYYHCHFVGVESEVTFVVAVEDFHLAAAERLGFEDFVLEISKIENNQTFFLEY